jgi:hypothetical protein
MAETTIAELKEQISSHVADLEHTQKELKKRSTLSFVERNSLSNKAAASVKELREQEAALEGKADEDEGAAALIEAAQAALGRAEKVLNGAHGTHGAAGQRGPAKGGGGQQRRGVGSMSQQRAPNRSGSE